MAHQSRSSRSSASSATTQRKLLIGFALLLSLILVGTVIVLSSVSYYLAIPSGAYLTEDEVPWTGSDIIRELKVRRSIKGEGVIARAGAGIRARTLTRKQDWAEVSATGSGNGMPPSHKAEDPTPAYANADDEEEFKDVDEGIHGVMGTETIPAVWDELADEEQEAKAGAFETTKHNDGLPSPTGDTSSSVPASMSEADMMEEDEVSDWEGGWDLDGKGTGGYWMRAGWDGQVKDTKSWERLYNVTTRPGERIPRLIHQTWKNDILPDKWRKAWKECREGMPDYEYFLWTDALSRDFVATHYPAFLEMYDSYKYPIQRADSIRYFILHHFGGIYMDLDIGCRRRMDELLDGDWEVILPITKPVGVSNDLIFSSKESDFMADTVNGLPGFNHEWFSNYPTVMFSTGPMFLSALYAKYTSAHPSHRTQVRILPKSLYGKNALPELVPHSFFSHFYGSSWHADDAGFIGFLGNSGITVMYIAATIVFFLVLRLVWQKYQSRKNKNGGNSSSAGYELLSGLPTMLNHYPGSQSRGGGRRRHGLLYFIPAIFQPSSPTRGSGSRNRGRTASDASQFPIAMHRRAGESESDDDGDGNTLPPPYADAKDSSIGKSRGGKKVVVEEMDEVDAFLKEQSEQEEAASSSSGSGSVGKKIVDDERKSSGGGEAEEDKDWEEWKDDK